MEPLFTDHPVLKVETIELIKLKPHPRNYRTHPADQLEHIKASIRQHGVYRNIVIAEDDTILAGHGVALACGQLGIIQVKIIRLPIAADSPAALKVLAGDNEIGHLAEINDRMFTGIMKELSEIDSLLGTGFDEMMLSNLIYNTKSRSEIEQEEEALWADAGMPDFENGQPAFRLIMIFPNDEARTQFCRDHAMLDHLKKGLKVWMVRWPLQRNEDTRALAFQASAPTPQ